MDATATQNLQDRSTPENEPRDSLDAPIAFDEKDENQSTLQSGTTLNEFSIPLDTSEPLGDSHEDPGTAATDLHTDLCDGLIAVEGQNLAPATSSPVSRNALDEEEKQIQASFQTLLQRPTLFTPVQHRPWLSQDTLFYTHHDEPSFADYFQQAITGLPLQQFLIDTDESHRAEEFDDGLIPSENQQITVFQPALGITQPDAQSSISSNALSQNLLSILERPTFLASPSARWTAPPQ